MISYLRHEIIDTKVFIQFSAIIRYAVTINFPHLCKSTDGDNDIFCQRIFTARLQLYLSKRV